MRDYKQTYERVPYPENLGLQLYNQRKNGREKGHLLPHCSRHHDSSIGSLPHWTGGFLSLHGQVGTVMVNGKWPKANML